MGVCGLASFIAPQNLQRPRPVMLQYYLTVQGVAMGRLTVSDIMYAPFQKD
jgi:hypothetical protein